jgi:hypothetical protein
MDSQHTIPTAIRAQGDHQIAWPADLTGEPDGTCVAVKVIVTQDHPGRDVDVLEELARVDVGAPDATVRELMGQAISALATWHFDETEMGQAVAEIDAVGPIDPSCPLVLEQLHERPDGRCVHAEALILPVSEPQTSELRQLRDGESDTQVRHGLGLMFAEDVAELWRDQSSDRRLPVRHLHSGGPSRRVTVDAAASAPVAVLAAA